MYNLFENAISMIMSGQIHNKLYDTEVTIQSIKEYHLHFRGKITFKSQ